MTLRDLLPKEPNFYCGLCGKRFNSWYSVEKHVNEDHIEEELKSALEVKHEKR